MKNNLICLIAAALATAATAGCATTAQTRNAKLYTTAQQETANTATDQSQIPHILPPDTLTDEDYQDMLFEKDMQEVYVKQRQLADRMKQTRVYIENTISQNRQDVAQYTSDQNSLNRSFKLKQQHRIIKRNTPCCLTRTNNIYGAVLNKIEQKPGGLRRFYEKTAKEILSLDDWDF